MIHQSVTQISLDSFRERAAGKKVILLYPWTNYRNLFLSHFLANDSSGFLYYRIPDATTSLYGWISDLVNELNNVVGDFGDRVRQLPPDAAPEQLGEALAADLAAYPVKPSVLFIDELDRFQQEDTFDRFITALVKVISPDTQIAVSSRLLTYQPWYDMVARGDAVILGTEHRKNNVMFTLEDAPKPQLEVYALGRGYALVNGQPVTNWDGALPRNLFFFFIDHPLVTRDEIFQTFWPDLSIKEATNVFHVTKRKIGERIAMKLGGGEYELTQYSSGFYIPGDNLVRHYDVSDFLEAVEQAMIATDERQEEALYRRAIEIYKAPFLHTVSMPWADSRREQLRIHYAQALIGMGRIEQRRENAYAALGYYSRTLKETPEREDIHREVMRIYITLGMLQDALDQYRRLEEVLMTSVGIGPAKETRELYEQITASH